MRINVNEHCVSGVIVDDGDVGGGDDTGNRMGVIGRAASASQRYPLIASSTGSGLGILSCLLSLFHGVSSDAASSEENGTIINATIINNGTAGNETDPDPEINGFDVAILTMVTLLSMFFIGVVLRICYRDGLEGGRGRGNNGPRDLRVIEGEDSDGGGDQQEGVALRVVEGGGDDAHGSEEGGAAGADNGGGDDRPQLEVVERVTSL
ncbi:hypothetical protein [Candidatus Ichthyocystis sparus]|uniref:hypothetical protein n=1 Tax=Candidatus Ichthyocystis sparus TaxID=1561004 RepID=UPI000B80EC20|nr:hypothetical protein [Candidatus Ichthyocystis sparus]